MERNIGELKEEVVRLEQAIETLQSRVEQARWLNAMLDRAKASHPRFVFWEWESRNFPTEAVRLRVEHVRTQLHFRIVGTWEFDATCKDIPGIPSELLYVARRPTIEEVYTLIKAASGFSTNAKVLEMFHVLKANGDSGDLVEFVLSAADA